MTVLKVRAFLALAGAATATLGVNPAQAQQLIQNGDFTNSVTATCTSTSWTVNDLCAGGRYAFDAVNVRSAPFSYRFVDNDPGGNRPTLSQSVAVATAGTYQFQFYYAAQATSSPHSFIAAVGANSFTISFSSGIGYTQFSQLLTLALGAVTVSFSPNGVDGTNPVVAIDDVSLTFIPSTVTPELPSNTPPNARNTATAIDSFVANGNTLPAGFAALTNLSGGALIAALNQASGQGMASGPTQTSYQLATQFMNILFDQSIEGRESGGASGYADAALAYAAAKPGVREAYAAVTPRDRRYADFGRWSTWTTGFGGNSSVSGNAALGIAQVTSSIYGAAGGADYRMNPNTVIGFAFGGAGTTFGAGQGLGSGRSDAFQIGAYGRQNVGAAYVAGALAYGWQDIRTSRTVSIAGVDQLAANFHANTFAARGELGYRYATPVVAVTPYGALQYTAVELPRYSENAASGSNQFALTYASRSEHNLRSELGLRSDKSFLLADGLFVLRGRAAWAHDSDTDRTITPTFQTLPGSSSFIINGAQPAADGALLTAGAEMKWHSGWSVAASYEGEFS
ncbi:MAG: autotransporter outer membrane beta-barrel domain-containing protein, partial [Pseudolabrys sp.]|nr:autotransporter outer membrane beta-barrel domain-containing protein [Pseudolabrys sp.]